MSQRREVPSKQARAPTRGGSRTPAPLFAALGDETRLRLIAVLCAGEPVSIARLTSSTSISRQAVTKHLHVLADVGLVRDVKVGRERLWQFDAGQLAAARRALDSIAGEWDVALGKLKQAVET